MSPPIQPTDKTPSTPGTLPEQALLRIVTENAHVGLVIVNRERCYAYANPTYAEILDLPSSNLVGQRLQDVLAEVYEEQVSPRLDRGFAGERVGYELRKTTAKGERYYSVRYEPAEVDGQVALVVVVIVDITERRQTQADSSRLAAIVESSDDAILSKDLDGIVTSWNAGAEKIFGYSAAEMVGSAIMRLIPPDRHGEEQHILEKIRRGEQVPHFETLRQTKSGQLIDVSVAISPLKDAKGKVIGASKVARDISQRKRADEALRFQQTMLMTERELTQDGILVVDASSKVLSFNGRFAQMWGISVDIPPASVDKALLQAVTDKVRNPESFMLRILEIHQHRDEASHDDVELLDGRTFDCYSAPMRRSDGHHYGRVWYFRDVTERKQAEAALRHERDRAQRFLDTAEVILLGLDVQGQITVINRKGCDLVGWTESELLGHDWINLCVPKRIESEVRQNFRNLLAGDLRIIANPILAKTGEERLIEWRSRVLFDDAGRPIGTFSSGSDITERHQAEEALRTAEERMRFALQNADVGIWDMDYATGIVRISSILEAHFGIQPDSFSGTFDAFMQSVYPDDRNYVVETIAESVKADADFSIQYRVRWPDGTMRWLSSAGRIHLSERGDPVRGVGITLDVTKHRSLEERYHQAQKMEAVGRLAGGVAHDFNNLLTAILGYSQLLLLGFDEADPRRSDLMEIHKAGESAARLTRQLLTFSRRQITEPMLMDLNVLLDNLRGMLGRLIGEDVKVVLKLRPELGLVKADSGQIEQIVMNLAVNARDAMPEGGTLTIETMNVELDDHYASTHFSVKPGRYVALVVSDTGTGLSPEVQARLFEPFFTTKERGKGTGLGLATVHGIVMRSGGSIGVYSELGKGSSFTIYLPLCAPSDVVADAPQPAARTRTAGETVLVVEDADGLREMTRRMLENQGYAVLLAPNASEARELYENSEHIDLILTDVIMPGGSGPELIRQLQQKRPDLKFIYMSGYTEDAISHHGVLDSGIAFLHKPFNAETLGRKLREVLSR